MRMREDLWEDMEQIMIGKLAIGDVLYFDCSMKDRN